MRTLIPIPLLLLRLLLLPALVLPQLCFALTYPLPVNGDEIVGQVQTVVIAPGQDLHALGRQYDVGYDEILETNPGLKPNKIREQQQIILPTRYILPPGPREGIVINLPEKRLYYFPPDNKVVMTFPIGIGQFGWSTPRANTLVVKKIKDPVWKVPPSVNARLTNIGIYLPKAIYPGPDDPLGSYALKLAIPGYLIHGTDDPPSIGTRASSGCIRMFPEDIETLFNHVAVNTQVRIIEDAYKVGWSERNLYLEAHPPLGDSSASGMVDFSSYIGHAALPPGAYEPNRPLTLNDNVQMALQNSSGTINWTAVYKAIWERRGLPQQIGVAAPR